MFTTLIYFTSTSYDRKMQSGLRKLTICCYRHYPLNLKLYTNINTVTIFNNKIVLIKMTSLNHRTQSVDPLLVINFNGQG